MPNDQLCSERRGTNEMTSGPWRRLIPVMLAVLVVASWLVWRAGTLGNSVNRYEAGDRFAVPPESTYTNVERLVLFVDSHCPFCEASAPFYRLLFGSSAAKHGSRPVIVVGWEDLSEIQNFLTRNDLYPAEVFSLKGRGQYAFRFTPTLLQVSSQGVIREVWIGQISKDQELRVLNSMNDEK